MTTKAAPRNRLLLALPERERALLLGPAELRALDLAAVIVMQGVPTEFVHFVESGLSSTIVETADGASVEIDLAGVDGLIPVEAALGSNRPAARVIAQVAGAAWCLPYAHLRGILSQAPTLVRLLARYADARLAMVARNAACNARHSVDQRMARWLLLARDAIEDTRIPLTHEFLALMLGVRRASVTTTAEDLRASGAIDYVRGSITIVDEAALLARSCDCYALMHAEIERIFAADPPPDVLPAA